MDKAYDYIKHGFDIQWSFWTGLILELRGGAVFGLEWILSIWLVGWSGFEAAELLELQFSNPIRQVSHKDRANQRRQQ